LIDKLQDFLDLAGIPELLAGFYEAFKIPVAIIDNQHNILIQMGLCKKFEENDASKEKCKQNCLHFFEYLKEEPYTTCPYGLETYVLPIRIRGLYLANFLVGPLLVGDKNSTEKQILVFLQRSNLLLIRMAEQRLKEKEMEERTTQKKLREAAQIADKVKGEFLNNISHEIRTPLNSIMGMAYLMQQTGLTLKQRDYLDKINASAKALLQIVNDILDFSKMEAGKLSTEKVNFNLGELLENVVGMARVASRKKGLDLLLEIGPKLPRKLQGDPWRVGQVLINLLSNAIKFTQQGSIQIRVECVSKKEKGIILKFSVRDTGVGIDAAGQKKLFKAFSQVDGSTTRQYGGTGLGLVISRQLVAMMGGDMWVESELGKGSTFSFTASFDTIPELPSTAVQTNFVHSKPGKKMDEIRILVVDDSEINQRLIRKIMENIGLAVTISADGQQALEALEKHTFAAVFMDLEMPVMDGCQVTAKIRQDQRFQDLPIIAMTAHSRLEDRERSLSSGMNDYLTKPINQDKILTVLSKWIKLREKPLLHQEKYSLLVVPGINVRAGLNRLGGSWILYKEILSQFAKNNIDLADKIKAAIQQRQNKTAAGLAHTTKGVAANIGAEDVAVAAAELETAINWGDHADLVDKFLDQFTDKLTIVLAGIQAFLGRDGQAGGLPKEGKKDFVDTAVLKDLILKIMAAMEKGLVEYMDYLEELEQCLPPLVNKELRCFNHYAKRFETDQALESLRTISDKLGISLEG